MKTTILIISSLCFTAVVVAVVWFEFFKSVETVRPPQALEQRPPSPFLQNGPYGENISLSEAVGVHTLQITAANLYLKKTKTFGFSNALVKNSVARDFTLTVFCDGRKRLELHKDKISIRPDMKRFVIENPDVRFPLDLKPVESVIVDKTTKKINLHHTGSLTEWDLTQKPSLPPVSEKSPH